MNNKIITIPNILTVIRFFLIPIFITLFLFGLETFAFVVFIIAGLTDALDGYIARKYQLISNIGKVLDPLADKALRLSAVIVFVIVGVLPLWVLVLMLSFDAFLIVTSIILYNKKYVVSSNIYGKLAGFVSMLALISCFFHTFVAPVHLVLVYISLVFIFVSIVSYIIKVKQDVGVLPLN
ncbi:MAG: CDP-diacylglycerol--glycerol-3-phosphate 3-phosphatidyltransferase [Tenericutes bacterium HGW-Tenericutes-4]|nr:MAG: CDP-diacylglycerol--glycerol-3-phosphate 3-phosphatidyltransferase [Tenericutes bacterium HGW-Tenericutes-4]